MEHLIANSGIQFIEREVEFNPTEPLIMPNGKTLKYTFCETVDFMSMTKTFDLLYYHTGSSTYIPVGELCDSDKIERSPNGREFFDETGLVKMLEGELTTLFSSYNDEDEGVYSINSLGSFRVKDPADGHGVVSAFNLLLGHWLPMPMFEREIDGVTANHPLGWCRMKMEKTGDGTKKGTARYRLVWAFDTQLGSQAQSALRPYFYEDEDEETKTFALCNRADEMLDFMSSGETFHAFSDYIAALLRINPQHDDTKKYIAYYIYFVNFIRLLGASPSVTLHNLKKKDIGVDLVLDIGNSRTCGVLFEEGDFTKSMMLELRDLSKPWLTYEKPFDMRLVFRKADFGNDIVLDDDLFSWKSFVRIGDEAKRLVYRSLEEEGLSERTTNYSSPKRYLWDLKPFEHRWEFLTTIDDPFNVRLSSNLYIPTLSDYFDENGQFLPDGSDGLGGVDGSETKFSRSSLMTFVFIEIIQQAIAQINSIKFRTKHGDMDCRRSLRSLIITCPTAMPMAEQVKLRQCAVDAYAALGKCISLPGDIAITPSPSSLQVKDDFDEAKQRSWSYDEASCCQLVYLYAEIAQRYNGEIHKFFELKGHVRPELKEEGYEGNALTIGTIDIGAGTTDIMVCAYECEGEGRSRITPIPLFWDSFYLAGDDILRNIVQNTVIEGQELGVPDMGNIASATTARLLSMSDAELHELPCLKENPVYKSKVEDILRSNDPQTRESQIRAFASNLIHDFFGQDSAMMSYKDRRCRVDFNTQISLPIAQKWMDLSRLNRPSKVYTYGELFPDVKPADYLLDYFARHFGFRFEELSWRFEPNQVANIVKSTMEPLMKQLSVILYAYHCDILVLAGRPTSLNAITELFVKYIPLSPNRLIRLNDYRVGQWYPFADGQGYFYDQKSVVAVGAMIGSLASGHGFNGLAMDFSRMIKTMKSTANYLGVYNPRRQQVTTSFLTPTNSAASLDIAVFPAFIGCKQFDSPIYQARPLYAIYNHSNKPSLRVTVERNYHEDRERITIEEACDNQGNTVPKAQVELVQQSLVDDGKYWLDKGEFELSIK